MAKKKEKEEKIYKDCWLYILLLTTLAILAESLKNYVFRINEVELSFSLFLLPFVYFLVNYIAKKYDYKKAIAAIAISGVIFVSYSAITSFALGEIFILSSVSGEFCGYVISQFVNLTIYMFLLNNTRSPFILVFLNYMFALVVYYLFYTLIYLNITTVDYFWIGYFVTLALQSFICYGLTILDKSIKRGIDLKKD